MQSMVSMVVINGPISNADEITTGISTAIIQAEKEGYVLVDMETTSSGPQVVLFLRFSREA